MKTLKRVLAPVLVVGLTLAVLAVLAFPALADEPWEPIPAPETGGGLVLAPKLESCAGRLQMAWAWTNEASKIKEPEFTYSNYDGSGWTRPKAPYFGDNIGRVRRVAMADAKQAVGAIFQRTLDQDDNAFEVLYAISTDGGWSYSTPSTADSFVHEGSTGTAVAMAGIGGRRPTFAMAWLTEAHLVRAGSLDPKNNSDRPRANNLGTYGDKSVRVEVAGGGDDSFVVVWSDGSSVKSARLKPIVGDPEETQTVAPGVVEMNFALTDWRGKRPVLIFETAQTPRGGGPRRQVMSWADRKWQKVDVAPPASGEPDFPAAMEAVQDQDGGLHVVFLPRTGDKLLYSHVVGGRWTEPETVMALNPNLGVTGFDVAFQDGYLYVVGAQGPRAEMARRKVGN